MRQGVVLQFHFCNAYKAERYFIVYCQNPWGAFILSPQKIGRRSWTTVMYDHCLPNDSQWSGNWNQGGWDRLEAMESAHPNSVAFTVVFTLANRWGDNFFYKNHNNLLNRCLFLSLYFLVCFHLKSDLVCLSKWWYKLCNIGHGPGTLQHFLTHCCFAKQPNGNTHTFAANKEFLPSWNLEVLC